MPRGGWANSIRGRKWQRRRQFPVLGAVAGVTGSPGTAEAIKVGTGLDQPLAGRWLVADRREMSFRTLSVARRAGCAVCGP